MRTYTTLHAAQSEDVPVIRWTQFDTPILVLLNTDPTAEVTVGLAGLHAAGNLPAWARATAAVLTELADEAEARTPKAIL